MLTHNARFYKTAFVVNDLADTATRLSRTLGLTWAEVPAAPYDFRIDGDVRTLTTTAIISRERPRIHLFAALPGTLWAPRPDGSAFHVAYWVNDIALATAQMLENGFRIEASDALSPDGPQHWAYFVDAEGLRIELLYDFGQDHPEAALDGLPDFTG